MGNKPRRTKEADRRMRHIYRTQSAEFRRSDPKQIVEDGNFFDELYRHSRNVKALESRPRGRAQSGELGEDTEKPKRKLRRLRQRFIGEDD